jgi:hypothetical protein
VDAEFTSEGFGESPRIRLGPLFGLPRASRFVDVYAVRTASSSDHSTFIRIELV